MATSRRGFAFAASAAGLTLLGLWGGPQPLDDALITLRYARSLAEGDGLVFNPGERVLGTTTPLFTLFLGAAHRLTSIDLVWLAYVAAVAGHAGTVVMLVVIGRRCEHPVAGWLAGVLYGLAPFALHPTVGCMETSLFVLATLYALAPSQRRWSGWRSGAATAAALLRPEGALTAALHLADACRMGRRAALRAAGLMAAGVVPWLAFATWYFGNPIPQSILAKWRIHVALPAAPVAEHFWYLLISVPIAGPKIDIGGFASAPFGTLIAQALPISASPEVRRIIVLLSGGGVLVLVCIGAATLYRRNTEIGLLLLFTLAYVAIYCLARPLMFPWYLVPPLPVLVLAFVAGGAWALRRILGRRAAPVAAAVGVLLVGTAAWQSNRYIRSFPATPRVQGYRAALQFLGPAAHDRSVLIGAYEIGALGYYSRARILDHAGLVSPEVLPLGHSGAVERYHPDFYIAYDFGLSMGGFLRMPAFVQGYELVARFPAYAYQGSTLVVYRKR